jgi:glycosyltransferase involved in cell wall biosynthesis
LASLDAILPQVARNGRGDLPSSLLALAIADVNWFTTQSLFRDAESPCVSVLGLRCMDYRNGWRQGILPWSRSCREQAWGPNSVTRDLVLPSGWMKRFPRQGMRPIARAIRKFWNRSDPAARRGLVLTYPHYLYLRDQLSPDRTLYYNIDDYALYWPRCAGVVRALERQMVLRTDATVCVARHRADELRAAIPEAAAKIHHLPHGTPEAFLAERPFHQPAPAPADLASLPRPILGYIGSIEGRVDWALLTRLSVAFPRASIVLVGNTPHARSRKEPWYAGWSVTRARPNVHAVGWRPQAELPRYYNTFDVILIPYLTDDPFNRACCPTKIADGLGSGRPIVATAIPECQLYANLFDVAATHDSFITAVRSITASDSDDGRALLRHQHARDHTCRLMARRVIQLLEGESFGTDPSLPPTAY